MVYYTVKYYPDCGYPGFKFWGIALLNHEPVGMYKSKKLAQENTDWLNSITPEYPGDCTCGAQLDIYLTLKNTRHWFCLNCKKEY